MSFENARIEFHRSSRQLRKSGRGTGPTRCPSGSRLERTLTGHGARRVATTGRARAGTRADGEEAVCHTPSVTGPSRRESRLPPHCPPSDLAHLVLDPTASLRALVHRPGVRFDQEGRRGCGGREPLSPSDRGKGLVMLARPVDVHAASDAAPFLIRCLCAALRTSHGLYLSSLRPSFGVHAVCSRFQDGSRCFAAGDGLGFRGARENRK